MGPDVVTPAPSAPAARSSPLAIAPVVVVVALLLPLAVARVRLASTLNVNWDEFYFLSRVHTYLRGALSEKLLTFHVHFLSWVGRVSPDEIEQVLAVRDVMLGFGVLAAAATAFIGWRLIGSAAGALFAVFSGQSLSLVLNHGASARYDPIIVALFLAAAALLVGHATTHRRARAVAAGILTAVALLVSIKAAVYLPALLGLLLCRVASERGRRGAVVDVVVFCGCVAVVSLGLLWVHAASLVAPSVSAPGSGGLGSIFNKVLVDQEFAQPAALMLTLRWDSAFWLLVLAGFALVFTRMGAGIARLEQVQLLCFLLPLFAIALYRNSFPYFYVTVVPPAALLAGVVVGRIDTSLPRRPLLAAALVALVALPGARAAWRWTRYNSDDQIAAQRQVIDAVHAVFPTPVPYVDRCGMIATFPKVGPFMSTWSLSEYRKRARPLMGSLLRQERPKFLLNNVAGLDLTRALENTGRQHRLLPDDFAVLKDNYIHYWGPIWIAGKSVKIRNPDAGVVVDVVIAGPYLLQAGGPIRIDGQELAVGAVIELQEGPHQVTASAPGVVTLRTALAQAPPTSPPPDAPIFTGFSFRTTPQRSR